jgi:predicted RNA-binding Zn-ribbon protein involved in translation (DUF1610 family)
MVKSMFKKRSEGRMMMKLEKDCKHSIDLANVSGDGSFQCPKCGTSISPEDETEDNYQILDTKLVNDELSELVIECGKCGCTIHLTGFQAGFEA